MSLDFYKLSEQPFGVTPDPRYLYLSRTHREALELIQYGVSTGRGFTALIAEPGMGKTTLLVDFLSKRADTARTVFLVQPQSTPKDLLRSLLEALSIPCETDDVGEMQRRLNEGLVRETSDGKQVIVVIDEAQGLDESVLEAVRMLSNFETPSNKLMYLVLSGQPALAAMLASPRLVQLRQRISIVARLTPLDADETQHYMEYRLRVAGHDAKTPLFTKEAVELIAYHSGGIPRNVNTLCFNALSLAGATQVQPIDAGVVEQVVERLDLRSFYMSRTENPRTRFGGAKQTSSRAAGSAFLGRRWLWAAVLFGLVGAVGGSLAWANWRSFHFVSPVKPRSQQSVSLPVPLSVRVAVTPANSIEPKREVGTESSSEIQRSAPVVRVSESPVSSVKKHISGRPEFVTLKPNQNIFRICLEVLGRYDDETVAKIRELNPELGDFNRISVGQKIRLPAVDTLPKAEHFVAAREPIVPAVKTEKP